MNKRGSTGRSLADRVTAPRTDERVEQLRRRHCWVLGAGDDPGPWPGLVAEWRRSTAGWEARVVYAVGDASTAEDWVVAERLRPASWQP